MRSSRTLEIAIIATAVACGAPPAAPDAGTDASVPIDAGADAAADAAIDAGRREAPRFLLIDDLGGARIYHGVNFTDDANPNSNAIMPGLATRSDLAQVASLGLNFVRLTRFWHALERADGVIDETYLDRTVELLDWCAELELACVLDLHQDIYAPKYGGRGFPDWSARDDGLPFEPADPWWLNYTSPAVQRAYDHFWQDDDLRARYVEVWLRFARRAAGHPGLLGYDLMNEPFMGTEGARRFEEGTLTDFYQELIDAIRREDPDAWIFVEPLAFAVNTGLSQSFLQPLVGERIAYFPHLYQPEVHEGGPYDPQGSYLRTWEQRRGREVERLGLPLLIGELGAFETGEGHADYLRDVFAMADRITSGWAYWDWGWGGGWSLIRDDRTEGALAGVLVRAYPERIAGVPRRIAFDPATRVLEVDFEDAAAEGDTVIVVPDRVYPTGVVLEAEGATSRLDAERMRLYVTTPPDGSLHRLRVAPRP